MNITVIGLGIIGSIWAQHLAKDGHQVRTWNRSAKPNAPGFTPQLLDSINGEELIMVVVADPPAVQHILDAIAPALKKGVIVAQHSTVGVSDTERFAAQVQDTGAYYLDMPFTGSKPAAEQRQNVFFVGDNQQILPQVEGVYKSLAKKLLPIGGIGKASAIKLAFNLLIANLNQAQSESFELARRSGIDPAIFFDALNYNVAKSGLADLKQTKYISGDYSPQFSIKHMHKDLRLALAHAKTLDLTLAETATVQGLYAEAEKRGLGDQDFSALLEIVRHPH